MLASAMQVDSVTRVTHIQTGSARCRSELSQLSKVAGSQNG